jgi:hypothetical protein
VKFALPRGFGRDLIARAFMAAAISLSVVSLALAAMSVLAGDVSQGALLVGVAIFAAWMASAIHQFQSRLSGIDEVIRQGRRRVEQSELVLEEMRRLARTLRASSEEEKEEDRTVH